jgi:GT2 family glycosyltransferase
VVPTVSVVVPVKDGARFLPELLAALARQPAPHDVLVVDSGSRDGSVALARAAGARVLEIDPATFGHGRTRNLAAEATTGEIVCFLTQDATPVDGWLDAILAAFARDPRIGAVYGPHLPRTDTSPSIARELTEFFGGFSPDGDVAIQASGPGEEPFLSNVNAAYRRACWAEIRFRDVAYAEDQAFGRDLLAAGWRKAFAPAAAVLHAHDYGPAGFARRYFDEYRGLRATTGYVQPFAPKAAAGAVRRLTHADRAWMRAHGYGGARLAAGTARAARHHAIRLGFSALGSRAASLPAWLRRALSLEGRG